MMPPAAEPQWFKLTEKCCRTFGVPVALLAFLCAFSWWFGGPSLREWASAKAESERAIGAAYTRMAADVSSAQARAMADHALQSEALREILVELRKNRPGSQPGSTPPAG